MVQDVNEVGVLNLIFRPSHNDESEMSMIANMKNDNNSYEQNMNMYDFSIIGKNPNIDWNLVTKKYRPSLVDIGLL